MTKKSASVAHVSLIVILALAYFPIFWMISTSFKPYTEWFSRPPVWISLHATFDNWLVLFGEAPAFKAIAGAEAAALKPIVNSAIIAGGATALAVVMGSLTAYAISRLNTGGTMLPFFVLSTRMVPPIAFLVPMLVVYSTLGLIDTYVGMIVFYVGVTLAFVVWLMKSFIDEIPKEIEEAATLDGYSQLNVIFRITLPLVKGGLFTAALFVFVLNWSELLAAMAFTESVAYTTPVQLSRYNSLAGVMFGPMAALATLATIPLVVFGYLMQKHLVRGMTFGAVRGRR